MRSKYLIQIASVLFIGILASCVYVPFLKNAIIFDDQGLFTSLAIYDYAQLFFNFRSRTFPYFTLGFIQVLTGSIEANRIFSLALHTLCAAILYLLLLSVLKQTFQNYSLEEKRNTAQIQTLAILGASWFVIHPVATYGAGYLAQRTILFAMMFSLSALYFYRRAFSEKRISDLITAAFFYSAAIFSKEHAIMLPLVALTLTPIFESDFRSYFKRISLFLALCLPATLIVVLATKHVVATAYEPNIGTTITSMGDIPVIDSALGTWLVSVIFQSNFFWDYLGFWIFPDVHVLSADMRFDFVGMWFSGKIFFKSFLFFVFPLIAIYFLRKKGLIALFCFGFLYVWLLFLTEISSIRFQEPFVLYRSYLWAPGYVMMLVAICGHVPRKWLWLLALPVFISFISLSRDRLTSLSTEASVWKDAASKLQSSVIIGSDRIFYNRGLAYLNEKKYEAAVTDFSRTIELNSNRWQPYYNRALAFYYLQNYSASLNDLDYALALNEKSSSIQYVRGVVFERTGCMKAAIDAYSRSMALGNLLVKMKLAELEKKNKIKRGRTITENSNCPSS